MRKFASNHNRRPLSGRISLRAAVFALFTVISGLFAALPVITNPANDAVIPETNIFEHVYIATDADGDSLSYSIFLGPAGITVNDTGYVSWVPNYNQAGFYTVIVRVIEHPSLLYVADTFNITVLDAGAGGTLTEIGASLGLNNSGVTNAAAWGDFDNDSIPDLFLANAGGPGILYHGASSGTSYSQSSAYSPTAGGDASSAAWADFDHDGRLDLYVVSSGLFGGSTNRLFRNDSSGVFIDQTTSSGTGDTGTGMCANWVDFDGDGDPDIYVTNFGSADVLYSNNHNGTFTAMSDSTGLNDSGDGVAAVWGDFNGDHLPDLYLVKEGAANKLYRNNGDSTFTDIATTAGVGHAGSGATAAWADYDNDGDFDLFLANKDSVQVLYSNDGDSTFTRLDSTCGLMVHGSARSAAWFDINLDGWQDLMVTFSDSAGKLFLNGGDSTFYDEAPAEGIDVRSYPSSVTWTDPDRDGLPDIYLGRRNGTNLFYDSDFTGNWLKVRLHGVVSSRFGVGAVVRVVADGRRYLRIVDGGSGSQSEPVALFGVDSSSTVDSLTVFWPAGLRRDTTSLAVNQELTWFETDSVFPVVDSTTIYPHTQTIAGPFTISSKITDNNSFTPLLFYSTNQGQSFSTVAMTASGGDFYDADIPGQNSGTRVYYYVQAVDSLGHTTRSPYFAPDSLYDFSVDDSVPTISSVFAFGDTADPTGPYPVTVQAADDDSLSVVWLVRAVYRQGVLAEHDSAEMELTAVDTLENYTFYNEMNGEEIGSQVDYYIHAYDLAGNSTLQPSDPVDSVYSFRVAHFSEGALTTGLRSSGWIGVAVADFNGDGLNDVYLANSDTADVLLQGTDTTLANVSSLLGTAGSGVSRGGYWGDYNNDGYPDLYIISSTANKLLSNDGDGTFTEISDDAGVADAGNSWAAAWVDYNRDGLLDLFVVDKDGDDKLYHNNGDSTFTDTAAAAGLTGVDGTVACAWADYDRDGWDDVYLVYYGTTNRLMRNKKNGTFIEMTSSAGVRGGDNSASATWIDYNNDLFPDLYLVEQAGDELFRNLGDATFTEADLSSDGLSAQPGGFGAAWADYDNDGYADMVKSRGELGKADLPAVLRGSSGGAFINSTYEAGLNDAGEHRGLAWLDEDSDGWLDLIVTSRLHEPRLYRNILYDTDKHFIRLKLVGTASLLSAVGAEVSAFWSGGRTMRRLGGGTGFTSSSEPVVQIGTGTVSMVDSVVIRWPSGMHQVLTDVAMDAEGTVIERDTLYPMIVSHDTIPDQYKAGQTPVVRATIADRDSATTVHIHYTIAGVDTLVDIGMTRDSVRPADGEIRSWWRYTMPALDDSVSNSWSVVITDTRGAMDSTVTFTYSVFIDSTGPSLAFIAAPDTILPDTTGPYEFTLRGLDNASVASISLRITGQTRAGAAISVSIDSTFAAGRDSVDVTFSVAADPIGSTFDYWAWATDGAGFKSYSDTTTVKVRPWRGRHLLLPLPVSISDVLRMAYIIVGLAQPNVVDSMGMDLDGNNNFTTEDLTGLLDLWRNKSLLSGAGSAAQVSASAALGDEPGGVAFELDNDGEVPWGMIALRFSDGAGIPVRLELSPRLDGLVHVEGSSPGGEIMLLFTPGQSGKGLPAGSGTLFRVLRTDGKESIPLPPVEIKQVNLGGAEVFVDPAAARAGSILPRQLTLQQNVPNPFNPSTTITFSIPESDDGRAETRIRLEVYNIRGSRVAVLADGYFPAGVHRIQWEGVDRAGRELSSGVYFYRMQASGRVLTRKMILLK